MWPTTLQQGQLHRFLFFCYILLDDIPPFIISSLRILFVRNSEVLLPNFLWTCDNMWYLIFCIILLYTEMSMTCSGLRGMASSMGDPWGRAENTANILARNPANSSWVLEFVSSQDRQKGKNQMGSLSFDAFDFWQNPCKTEGWAAFDSSRARCQSSLSGCVKCSASHRHRNAEAASLCVHCLALRLGNLDLPPPQAKHQDSSTCEGSSQEGSRKNQRTTEMYWGFEASCHQGKSNDPILGSGSGAKPCAIPGAAKILCSALSALTVQSKLNFVSF